MIQGELEHVKRQHEELGRSGLEAEVKLVLDLGTEALGPEETEEKRRADPQPELDPLQVFKKKQQKQAWEMVTYVQGPYVLYHTMNSDNLTERIFSRVVLCLSPGKASSKSSCTSQCDFRFF